MSVKPCPRCGETDGSLRMGHVFNDRINQWSCLSCGYGWPRDSTTPPAGAGGECGQLSGASYAPPSV